MPDSAWLEHAFVVFHCKCRKSPDGPATFVRTRQARWALPWRFDDFVGPGALGLGLVGAGEHLPGRGYRLRVGRLPAREMSSADSPICAARQNPSEEAWPFARDKILLYRAECTSRVGRVAVAGL
jgi:hypothetical protein